MKKAIEVKGYSFRYAGTEADVLKNCDFTLDYGEFVVLSGDSGAGKSTLLAALIGSIPHILQGEQKGEILIGGQNIAGKRICELSRLLGSVLQDADSQIVHGRVEDEIAFGCENLGLDAAEIERRIDKACSLMKLDRTWSTSTLSGGQKQRLIAAAALAMGQKILAFDEPLANLDRKGAHLLLGTLKKMAKQGYAVLFVEHRLDMVAPYADRIVWMNGGRCATVDKNNYRKHLQVIEDSGGSAKDEPCLELNNISFHASGREILKEISLTVRRGERVVILGENGSGKTTLLRIMARLQKPSGGEVRQYLDKSLRKKASPRWFKKVGYVYQNPNYQLFMPSVAEEIGYQSPSEADTRRYIERFGLAGLRERHPHSLSEGQKRKLSIAAIAALKPDILLLDEPTVGQDYEALKRMTDTLNRISRELGTALVTVTHDYRCAGALADRVIWIDDGTVYRSGGKEVVEDYFNLISCRPAT